MDYPGKLALVVGMGKTGRAAAAFLRREGARVSVTDTNPQDDPGFRPQTDALFAEPWDLIVLSPGVAPDQPAIAAAAARGITVTGELELAAGHLLGNTLGITGSNGKTTTTALTGHIFAASGLPAQVGGNIGTPVVAMCDSSKPGQWNILELSSFQLEMVKTFRVEIGVCLNVTQNHLDRHHTFENYAAAKGNLFRTQVAGSYAVLNADDPVCQSFSTLGPGETQWFSSSSSNALWHIANQAIYRGSELLMPLEEIPIPGLHNVENVMAAAAAAHLAGISLPQIRAAVKTFHAVEHRLEFVAEIDGVRYFNDSKATSVDATMKAIDSFPGGLWIILGGKDKGSDYTTLRQRLQNKAHAALLIGTAAEKIAAHLDGALPLIHAGTLERAVAEAHHHAQAGDTVLLAPACASFDQFQSYEHRGQVFKQLVKEMQHGTAA